MVNSIIQLFNYSVIHNLKSHTRFFIFAKSYMGAPLLWGVKKLRLPKFPEGNQHQ